MVYDIAEGTYILFITADRNTYLEQSREDFVFDESDSLSIGQLLRLTNIVDSLRNHTKKEVLDWIYKEWDLEPRQRFPLAASEMYILTETFEW